MMPGPQVSHIRDLKFASVDNAAPHAVRMAAILSGVALIVAAMYVAFSGSHIF